MNCKEMFACVERLDFCTGSEILAMTEHVNKCPDCLRQIEEIAKEYDASKEYDKEATEQLARDTIQRALRATTDPEIVR